MLPFLPFRFLSGKAPKSFAFRMYSFCLWAGFPARKMGQEGRNSHILSAVISSETTPPNWRGLPAQKSPSRGQMRHRRQTCGPRTCGLSSQVRPAVQPPRDKIKALPHPRGSGLPHLHHGKLWLTHAREYSCIQAMASKLSEKLIPRFFIFTYINCRNQPW